MYIVYVKQSPNLGDRIYAHIEKLQSWTKNIPTITSCCLLLFCALLYKTATKAAFSPTGSSATFNRQSCILEARDLDMSST